MKRIGIVYGKKHKSTTWGKTQKTKDAKYRIIEMRKKKHTNLYKKATLLLFLCIQVQF